MRTTKDYLMLTLGCVVTLIVAMLIPTSCTSDAWDDETEDFNTVNQTDGEKLLTYFQSLNLTSIEDAIEKADSLEYIALETRRGGEEPISKAVYDVIEEYQKLKFDEDDTLDTVRIKLLSVVNQNKDYLTLAEYTGLIKSIDLSILAMQYAVELQATTTRGMGDKLVYAIKCIGGTAGSAGLGVLAGAGVGTVTLPIIGTVSGTALGGWSGALVGIATFC